MISDGQKFAFEEHLISFFRITFCFLFKFYSTSIWFDWMWFTSFLENFFRVFYTKHWLANENHCIRRNPHRENNKERNLSNGTHRRATDTTNTKPYNNHHHLKMKAKFELVLVWPPKKKNIYPMMNKKNIFTLHVVAASRVLVCVRVFFLVAFDARKNRNK